MKKGADKKAGFSTRALHDGYDPKEHNASRAVPLYQTTAYLFRDTEHARRLFAHEEEGWIYTRIGNPTVDVLEKRIASLEEGDSAVAFASGMAAISASILALLRPGDEIVSSSSLYGGTYNLLSATLQKFGIKTNFVDASAPQNFKKATTSKTKLCYAETIGNPRIDVPDLSAIAEIAHSHCIPFFVDNTLATPYVCRPIEYGADAVLHSASKFIGGHGNSLGGLLVTSNKNIDWVKHFPHLEPYTELGGSPFATCVRAETLRDYGGCVAPMNAFFFITGLETLALRMQKHCENAAKVARFLKEHPKIDYVNYPIFDAHPSYKNAKKYLQNGCGALLSFGVKGGFEAGKKVVNNLKLVSFLANLGDTKTLILHPASTSHEQLSPEERISAGAPDELLRLSVGIEDSEDIIADLTAALDIV